MHMNFLKSSFRTSRNSIHLIGLSCNTIPPVKYGGIELVISNLCVGLTELGAKVFCYSPGSMSLDNVTHLRTLPEPSLSVKAGGKANTIEHLDLVLEQLKKHSKRGDVVVFNHPEQFRYLKRKMGYRLRSILNLYEIAHTIDAGVYRNVIYPSKSLKEQVNKPGFVIYHGVNLLFGKANGTRTDNLFYAGSIDSDKGVDIALEVCKEIGCRLVIAGPRSNSTFEQEILNNDLVEYLGELSYPQLFEEYKKHRALIYMTQINEPFGLVVIEAMAAGMPVITTGNGGTGESVILNRTGLFASDVNSAIRAYRQILDIESEACINRAMDFTYNIMAEKYLNLITSDQSKKT